MNLYRFYCDLINKPVTELNGLEAHHLFSVLRLRQGDNVELFDGKGILAKASVISCTNKKVLLQIDNLQTVPCPGFAKVIIAPSIAKGDRFDLLIGKCTELGVDRICPVIFERTVKQASGQKILERWQKVAISACKQCQRLVLPQIDKPASLTDNLENVRKECPNSQLLVGSLSENLPSLVNMKFGNDDVIAFVGPEGGLTENEISLLHENKAKDVHITNTVLRIETAAIAFTAILTAQRDALKNKPKS